MSSLFRIDRRFIHVGHEHGHHKHQPEEHMDAFGEPYPLPMMHTDERYTALLEEAEAVLSNAQRQAEELVQQARDQARALVEEGREQSALLLAGAEAEIQERMQRDDLEAVELRGQAWQKGYEEGLAQADADVKRWREADHESLRRVLEEIDAQRNALFSDFERDLVDLSLALAKKIINTVIKNDDNAYESMIRHALSGMKREGSLTIRVDRDAYQRLFAGGTATFALAEGAVCVSVTEDPTLEEGGLLLESELEALDAGVDTQLRNISLAFHCAAPQGEISHG